MSLAINELAAALSKAQSEIKDSAIDKKNPHFRAGYSSLAAVWDACREPLTKNGISVVQSVEGAAEAMYVKTYLLHSSGQYMTSECPLITDKKTMQGIGSAITYAKRYSLAAMVGVASSEDPEEDDGEGAEPPRSSAKPPANPGDYVIQIGKEYKGKKLSDIPDAKLGDFATWIHNLKDPSPALIECYNAIERYFDSKTGGSN